MKSPQLLAGAILLLLLTHVFAFAQTTEDEGWTDLFNGEDLSGWVQRNGEAEYLVEDNTIVGNSAVFDNGGAQFDSSA